MITEVTIADAIKSLHPTADFAVKGDEILWFDEVLTQPTSKQIDDERQAIKYKTLRLSEYPSIAEQLDMQYWDTINDTTTWFDAIKSIKDKYPKDLQYDTKRI